MNYLEYKQMREREQAVVDSLNKKLGNSAIAQPANTLSNLQNQLMIVSKKLNELELWVMRDAVEKAILALNEPKLTIPKPEMCFGRKAFAYVHLDALIESVEASHIKYVIEGVKTNPPSGTEDL